MDNIALGFRSGLADPIEQTHKRNRFTQRSLRFKVGQRRSEDQMQDVQVICGRLLNTVLYFNPSSILDGVIDKNSFVKVRVYLEYAPKSDDIEILIGGDCDDSAGFFVSPTFVLTNNPKSRLMREGIFGPVITIYVYNDLEYEQEPAALQ